MPDERAQRRLAAILAADVVGYSRLMQLDETGTFTMLKSRRKEILQPIVGRHHGRVVKLMGDGVLVEFASAVHAVECAVELQEAMEAANASLPDDRRILLRVGINLGDVIAEGHDLYGDGVNIAARLEALAEPGGVLISGKVREEVTGKIGLNFEDLGEQSLKNITGPVRAYRARTDVKPAAVHSILPLPDKPSIAVLPFQNMSGDVEQEYFTDGMVEEITTALSRFRNLFVIARNSSFTYKGRAVDVKQVGRELGVRYVLEGSVRKAGNRVRITGQLIDATIGVHLWADRFDGGLEDIFDLQDQVTVSVVGAIAPKLEQAEIERAKRKPTEKLDAYDYYLRGLASVHQWTKEANGEALSHFYRAIELDPNFASAYGLAARCYAQRKASGWMADRASGIAETSRLVHRAAELGRDDAVALCMAGFAAAFVAGDLDEGSALIDRALQLNPNLAWAWLYNGWVKVYLGDPEVALERIARAMRLSPNDPQMFNMQTATAYAHFVSGRYAEALKWAESAVRERPSHTTAVRILAASCAMSGQLEQAQKTMTSLRGLDPELRISNLEGLVPFRKPEHFAKWEEGLRRAGLPE